MLRNTSWAAGIMLASSVATANPSSNSALSRCVVAKPLRMSLAAPKTPLKVLEQKVARAHRTLHELRASALTTQYTTRALGGLRVRYERTLQLLRQLADQIEDARRYAHRNGLKRPVLRKVAQQALLVTTWHLSGGLADRTPIVGALANAVQAAEQARIGLAWTAAGL